MFTSEARINTTVFTTALVIFSLMALFSSQEIEADLSVQGDIGTSLLQSVQGNPFE